ncbi:hypothetical protein [Leptolyngbya sp. FACHB-261]|uniref:hypothetical protein n=1 Tax=Leptolyngbya sp. FACHB-261 TaxID=2692806 RepID=UPI001684B2CE|nr:hypothetical protein [Leptolyngbya sp. FACHB-261]MBD2102447.1 hypothetical protein [Leptolyngbya sp. FACHB-261]
MKTRDASVISLTQRATTALMLSSLLLGMGGSLVQAASPLMETGPNKQLAQGWDLGTELTRLVSTSGQTTDLQMALMVRNKPVTSYANAVYQLYARSKGGRWQQVYVSPGARLLPANAGSYRLPVEVVSLRDLQRSDMPDLTTAELRSVVQVRYDLPGGARDQRLELEQLGSLNTLAIGTQQSTVAVNQSVGQSGVYSESSSRRVLTQQTSQGVAVQNTYGQSGTYVQGTYGQGTYVQGNTVSAASGRNNVLPVHRGHFSLAVLQKQPTLSQAIARVSLKSLRSNGYLSERYIGDFRFNPNERARFVQGINPGDRVVVRLFDTAGRFLGLSEFETLSDNAAVTLMLSDRPLQNRLVRTIVGLDTDLNGVIDRSSGSEFYDFFTLVSGSADQNYRDDRVTFLSRLTNITTSLFTFNGYPSVPTTFLYPVSFVRGNFTLVDRAFNCFTGDLAPAILARPGQMVNIVSVTNNTTYQASTLIFNNREVGVITGDRNRVEVERDDDDDDDDDDIEVGRGRDDDDDDDDDDDREGGRRRRSCNQGIGNGAEGCDPGNSRPHGGSNDEGGSRQRGNNRRD